MPKITSKTTPKSLAALEKRIDYVFVDKALLQRALTHRSSDAEHMERLEFLGDAVLGLVISDALHHTFAGKPEGDLSRMRAALVRKESLLEIAELWGLAAYLHVGESERMQDCRRIKSPSIAANAVEAVIGAVFEDGGWIAAHRLVKQTWGNMLHGIGEIDTRDAKSRLQELTQCKGWGLPVYELVDLGVGQSPRFVARCQVHGEWLSEGHGERKKTAEIEAAEQAWQKLKR